MILLQLAGTNLEFCLRVRCEDQAQAQSSMPAHLLTVGSCWLLHFMQQSSGAFRGQGAGAFRGQGTGAGRERPEARGTRTCAASCVGIQNARGCTMITAHGACVPDFAALHHCTSAQGARSRHMFTQKPAPLAGGGPSGKTCCGQFKWQIFTFLDFMRNQRMICPSNQSKVSSPADINLHRQDNRPKHYLRVHMHPGSVEAKARICVRTNTEAASYHTVTAGQPSRAHENWFSNVICCPEVSPEPQSK